MAELRRSQPSGLQDPRAQIAGTEDIRPLVAERSGRTPVWLLAGGAVLGGVLLFALLDGHRRSLTAPATRAGTNEVVQTAAALPPLYLAPEPPPPPEPPAAVPVIVPVVPNTTPMPMPMQMPSQPPQMSYPPPSMPPNYTPPGGFPPPQASYPSPANSSGSALVIDKTVGVAADTPGQESAAAAATAEAPARASRLGRRATTVPQGTLIQAVLETALDSTRPGNVRAIVSQDVSGFDGSQVLIPRGTRLFGEYAADLTAGQNRAFVQWTRLVRPDGVTIALASPASDIQGRAGIPGRVNSHFLARFGNAFLQSTLNFGMGLAGRSLAGDSSLVVALPGALSGGAPTSTSGSQVKPTLRVDAGIRVAVLVARDLEFPSVEARR